MEEKLREEIKQHPYPLLFVTLSGAHLYGFPSPDSDFDLRGVHLLPASEVLSLEPARETIEVMEQREGLELDLVTHDLAKFMTMMLKRNGYVMEQLYSPIVLHTSPEHQQLRELGKGCLTSQHAHHYLGFARGQWQKFADPDNRTAKALLYTYRVLLTGIHLMRSGTIEANLLQLNREFNLSFIDELVAFKTQSGEKTRLNDVDLAFHEKQTQALTLQLEEARDKSNLPMTPSGKEELSQLLVTSRLKRTSS